MIKAWHDAGRPRYPDWDKFIGRVLFPEGEPERAPQSQEEMREYRYARAQVKPPKADGPRCGRGYWGVWKLAMEAEPLNLARASLTWLAARAK